MKPKVMGSSMLKVMGSSMLKVMGIIVSAFERFKADLLLNVYQFSPTFCWYLFITLGE